MTNVCEPFTFAFHHDCTQNRGLKVYYGYINTKRIVKSISFPITSLGYTKHTITFEELLTSDEAIRVAEDYLSQALTAEDYTRVENILHEDELESYKANFRWFKSRGACLGRNNKITHVFLHPDGLLILFTASLEFQRLL